MIVPLIERAEASDRVEGTQQDWRNSRRGGFQPLRCRRHCCTNVSLNMTARFDMASSMRAMVLERARDPLRQRTDIVVREPAPHEVLVRVHASGVCRTDLHIVDGELSGAKRDLVPGPEI